MKKSNYFLGIAAGLAALLAAGPMAGVANAQTPPAKQQSANRPTQIMGVVGTVQPDSLTVKTRRGEVTANLSEKTWILARKDGQCIEGSPADLEAAKPVSVAGLTTSQANVLNARVVTQDGCRAQGAGKHARPGKQIAQHFGAGTIKSINATSITLTADKGVGREIVVNTTADTTVINNGFVNVSTLKVGDKVQVLGRPEKSQREAPQRTLTAWALRVVNSSTKLVTGRVESISGNTLALKTPANRNGLNVTLDITTAYRSLTVADSNATLKSAAQGEIKVGSMLTIEGVVSADGKGLAAKAVIVMPAGKNAANP